MKEIKKLITNIKNELDSAEEYADLAVFYKDSDRSLSETYATMANQEFSHVDALHAQIVRLIRAQQNAGKEVPPAMQAVWDYEHETMIERVAKVRVLLEQYRK